MGNILLDSARHTDLPDDINTSSKRNNIIKSWTKENIIDFNKTQSIKNVTTIEQESLADAAELIRYFFAKNSITNLIVLDIFSGNCSASLIIKNILGPRILSWMCTDVIDFDSRTYLSNDMYFECLHSVDAVAKYGATADVLIMISPTPFPRKDTKDLGYGDYYACHDFIGAKNKYIIFIGELGASDGSSGMYKYMLQNPNLELLFRQMLKGYPIEQELFGPIEKELFIFKTI
jgi:hypothetical protein